MEKVQFELKYCSNSQQSATIVNGSITFSTRLSWSSTCSALPIASSVQMSPSMSFRDKTVSYVHFDTIGFTLINLQINYRSQRGVRYVAVAHVQLPPSLNIISNSISIIVPRISHRGRPGAHLFKDRVPVSKSDYISRIITT